MTRSDGGAGRVLKCPAGIASAGLLVLLASTLGCSASHSAGSANTTNTTNTTSPPVSDGNGGNGGNGGGGGPHHVYRLAPAKSALSGQLASDVPVIVSRFRSESVTGASVSVSGDEVVVTTTRSLSKQQVATTFATGNLLFRPVLCAAPMFKQSTSTSTQGTPGPLPSTCPAANALTASNIDLGTAGNIQGNVPPWSLLSTFASTAPASDVASRIVLLPSGASAGFGAERLLLGPAQVVGLEITSAEVAFESPQWIVNVDLDPGGSQAYDTLAQQQFHAFIAFDLDGEVISAPIIFPEQSSFSSFGGKVQIAGFTQTEAESLAEDLSSGPLPVPLTVAGESTS